MAALTGNDGSVTMPTGYTTTLIRSFTANAEYTVSEVTGFADVKNRRNRRGLPVIRGTMAGTNASAADPGVGAGGATGASAGPGGSAMTLTAVASNTWVFTALMSNIGLAVEKTADSTLTYEFVSGDADDFAEAWS